MAVWKKVCQQEEVPPGQRKQFPIGMMDVIIINTGKRFFACGSECPHLGVNLMEGEVQGHVIRCNAHGYQMDLTNGKCLTEAGLQLPTFPLEVRDGWIWIKA